MRLAFLVAFSLVGFNFADQVTMEGHRGGCGQGVVVPLQRREWRTLGRVEKKSYIEAVRCLQRLAPITSFPAVKSRFDDFQAVHINLTDGIHLVGHFLPWHRQFLHVYEYALREECNYTGANPYWDWTKDSSNISTLLNSPVFDPITGFGGTGTGPQKTVTDGPFASYHLAFGPGRIIDTHPLKRDFNATMLRYVRQEQVANTTRQPTYELFRVELEGRPVTEEIKIHDGGHRLVGGDMGDTYSSPGDPLFYLHHANLDRIWWEWQQVDAPKRLYEISGRSTVIPPFKNVTLDYHLEMRSLSPRALIHDVMDILGGHLCYEYI